MKETIASIVIVVANVYMALILIRSFMGWVRQALVFRHYWFFGTIIKLTDPLLIYIRRVFPVNFNQWDFSPVIAIILVEVIKDILLIVLKLAAR